MVHREPAQPQSATNRVAIKRTNSAQFGTKKVSVKKTVDKENYARLSNRQQVVQNSLLSQGLFEGQQAKNPSVTNIQINDYFNGAPANKVDCEMEKELLQPQIMDMGTKVNQAVHQQMMKSSSTIDSKRQPMDK